VRNAREKSTREAKKLTPIGQKKKKKGGKASWRNEKHGSEYGRRKHSKPSEHIHRFFKSMRKKRKSASVIGREEKDPLWI